MPSNNRSKNIPKLISSACSYLEDKVNVLGLFASCSKLSDIVSLRGELMHQSKSSNKIFDNSNPHVIANMVVEYFKDIPDPLVPLELVSPFPETGELKET